MQFYCNLKCCEIASTVGRKLCIIFLVNFFFRIYLNAEHVAYWNLFVVAQNVQGSVTKDMTASKYCVLFLIIKSMFCGFICLLTVNSFFPWLKCSAIREQKINKIFKISSFPSAL